MPSAKRKKKDADFEIWFYEGILERDPDFVEALMPLGNAYTERGHYDKGLEIDLKLSRLLPTDPIVFYNLACSHSLLGQITSAIESLEKALRLGYKDWNYLTRDPDLANVRKDPRFEEFLKKHRQKENTTA
jgi:tetratricopeptide (TPR) repeat protein